MRSKLYWMACAGLLALAAARADENVFQDDFPGKLGEGWSWVREHREAWRVTPRGLEVRIEPGNMWGPGNSARNVLVRNLPEPAQGVLEIALTVENRPTEQFEQVDLVWYYNDSFMVKLGQELVDGKLSVVMGREEGDRTRTIAIVPLDAPIVRLRLTVTGNRIHGEFRPGTATDWKEAGTCELPAPAGVPAKVSFQCYQGPANAEHWAKLSEFRVVRRGQ